MEAIVVSGFKPEKMSYFDLVEAIGLPDFGLESFALIAAFGLFAGARRGSLFSK